MKKIIGLTVGGIAVALILFVLWPTRLDPVAWQPPEGPGFAGAFALNEDLSGAEVIALESGHGPEDVAVDAQGRIYGGLDDGRIVRILADGTQETFATIDGGRPLGLHFDAKGNLIVADAWKGLLSVDRAGTVSVLATGHGGVPFAFTDDLDIASDGKIYFSDASDTYSQPDYRLDLLEARGHGRLLAFDPASGKTELLLDNLYFANGIALSAAEDFVLVNETGRYRVTRYWLSGDKAGTHDIFIDNLPGFPDGISGNGAGLFWLALPSPRNPMMDKIHPSPWKKRLVSKLPTALQPSAIPHGIVVALDESGNVVRTLHDSDGDPVYMITSVEQVDNMIYLGSLEAPQIVRMQVPASVPKSVAGEGR
jgi:sugar lactone lactonase YvrE